MKKSKKSARRRLPSKKPRKKRTPPVRVSPRAVAPEEMPGNFPAAGDLGRAMAALQASRPQEALGICGQVLAAEPDNADALNLAGVAAFQSGDGAEAISLLETAIAFRPDFADAHNNLGNVLKAAGEFGAAEARYRIALDARPGYWDAEYNLGIALEAQGRFADAEASYRRCLNIDSGSAAAHFNLGNVLKALGRFEEAMTAYQRALEINPDLFEARNNLGTVEMERGRAADAIHSFRNAIGLNPGFAEAHYNLGIALQETGDWEEAIACYRKAIDCDPGHAGAQINIGYALKEQGKLDDAVEAYESAITMAPEFDKVRVNLGDVYLAQGKAQDAIDLCDAYLQDHPGNISMLAFKAIALEEAGLKAAVGELYDFDRLLRPNNPIPEEFPDLAAFNAALADHLLGHPSLTLAPKSHATRFGRHSGELLVEPKGPVAALEGMIMAAVEEYREAVPPDLDHPFLAHRPERLGLSIWGVAMDSQGHQLAHIHPSAWLSGVYYPKIPAVIAADDPDHAGWIEFGRPPEDFYASVEPDVRLINPEEGLMVLFPSYFYHRTIPYESDDVRISVAFDVLAAE
ncbi:MAG TPA: tetratricopeptide repeat protein [Rhodospirillales bacterium]|nr:tetratricopeptide repeat protein [Rhodospirillales bacterium]